MALTLIVEDGTSKPDSNTYIGLADADAYFEGRLHAEAWTAADDPTKSAALVHAARMLDQYISWLGEKSNTDQAMEWPRWGVYLDGSVYYMTPNQPAAWVYAIDSDTIPRVLKDAQCELALVLIGQDTQSLPDTAGLSSISVAGAVDLQVDKRDRIKEIPEHVFKIVSHFGNRKGKVVKLMRC
jgi:hypothetical protein